MKFPITVTILTKNSLRYIYEVLQALSSFDEVLIYDTGSTDDTLSIAQTFPNVVIYEHPFIGFGPTHNAASQLAKNDWIFSIDSDEIATPLLVKEICSLTLESGRVYSIPRDNEYKGKAIKWCGWYPDYQTRIYNRMDTHFTDAQVHESIITESLNVVRLNHPIHHYSYANAADFLSKMQSYSELFALQNQGKKSSSMGKALCHGFFAFLKSYVLKRGFMGGAQGFEISVYNANTAFYKYLKLAEKNAEISKIKERV